MLPHATAARQTRQLDQKHSCDCFSFGSLYIGTPQKTVGVLYHKLEALLMQPVTNHNPQVHFDLTH